MQLYTRFTEETAVRCRTASHLIPTNVLKPLSAPIIQLLTYPTLDYILWNYKLMY